MIQQMSLLREIVEVDLLREIVLLQINLLRVVLFSNRFIIHNISMQRIDQIKDVD
jgi:hypothetical protein